MRIVTSTITTTATATATTTAMGTAMTTDAALYRLLAWTSPAYPVGAFSYSHGLEWAVEAGQVRDVDGAVAYIAAVLERGGGWVDAVLFAATHRVAGDPAELDGLADLAAAFRASSETALESRQQGQAFLTVTRRAWPHPLLDEFARRRAGLPVAHCTAMAVACAAHGIALEPALHAYLHGIASNLVSAAVRLVPLGQTDGQIATARLGQAVAAVGRAALAADIDELGTAAPGLELCSLAHETQYTRLFRS
ncbi:urease accessory protein UreF [Indioceanicola profundi]|uniref:urease accessory protein UreF n=1 Tax=Indioceanicola profundi TaxID=2220096 RepID=UPI001CEC374A|nr:urease accessory protein UreF [Indioceanicola profundi]